MFEVSAPHSDLILFEALSSTALSLVAVQPADTCSRQARGTENLETPVSFTGFIVFNHFRYFSYEVACLLFCFCLFGFLISEKTSKLSKCSLLLLSAVVLLSDSRGQAAMAVMSWSLSGCG